MVFWFIVIGAIFIVFRSWLGFGLITSGDLSFFFPEQIQQYLNPPFAWETFRNSGLGGGSLLHQGVYLYNLPMGFLGQYLDYGVIQRIIWFFPILVVGFLSPVFLAKEINIFPQRFYPLSSLIFLLNTYFLMIMGGGQLTVVLAYIMIPLTLALFFKTLKVLNAKNLVIFSLSFSFLIAWDFRLAYIFGGMLFFYFLFFWTHSLKILKKCFLFFFWTVIIVLGFHAFWLLPFLLHFNNPVVSLTSVYTASEAVRFFSFASFSKAISLFHPNWPENIFGKVNFLNPAFLVLPVIAFSSLLFINELKSSRVKKKILFFASLALMGAFLAKGSNPPFGGVYLWLFKHFPGMIMFRDATKFYTLTALSYSILIPWVLSQFQGKKAKLFPWLFALFWLFLIPQAWLGKIGGTLKPKPVPQDYVFLKDFLVSQNNFFRTLWLPTWQRFAFYSHQHPAMAARDWMADEKCFSPFCDLKMEKYNREYFNCHPNEHCFPADFSFLAHPQAPEVLSQLSVKYLIIPYDSEGEIFKRERKYDEDAWKQLIEFVESLGVYQPVDLPGKVRIYQLPETKDHFWLASDQAEVNYQAINPTKYKVQIQNARQPFKLVFSETYDELWQGKIGERTISSKRAYDQLNSFSIEQFGDFEITVEYAPQKYVYYGLIVSGITALCVLLFLKHC